VAQELPASLLFREVHPYQLVQESQAHQFPPFHQVSHWGQEDLVGLLLRGDPRYQGFPENPYLLEVQMVRGDPFLL